KRRTSGRGSSPSGPSAARAWSSSPRGRPSRSASRKPSRRSAAGFANVIFPSRSSANTPSPRWPVIALVNASWWRSRSSPRLRSRVPEGDRALLRHADDRVERGIEDGPHLGRRRAQAFLGAVTLRVARGGGGAAPHGEDGHGDTLDREEADRQRLVRGGEGPGSEKESVAGHDGEDGREQARTEAAPPAAGGDR